MRTAAEETHFLLDELFSRRARGIYDELLARTGSRSLAAELCREAFLRVQQTSEGLDAPELDALLARTVEDAYLTYRDLSLLHDELFSPPGPMSAPAPSAAGEEAVPPPEEEIFSPPGEAPTCPSLEPPSPPCSGEPAVSPAAEPEASAPALLYDFQKEEVSSYFSNEPSVTMPPPKKGSRLGVLLAMPFLILLLLLFLWLLTGLLMSLGVIPFSDLGYLWFNSHIFRLF